MCRSRCNVLARLFLDAGLRKQKAKDEANVVPAEGSVVYIRGFDLELTRFAYTSTNHEENNKLDITYKPNRLRRGQATFAGFLEPTVPETSRHLAAHGNLNDRLPPHGGSAAYTADREWREQFAWLMEHSRCVITFPHRYRQLRSELGMIRKTRAHRRLFILTPPSLPWRKPGYVTTTQAKRWNAVADEAAKAHERFGPHCYTLGENPRPGAVVTFDADGKAVVLHRNATTPADYVSVIKLRWSGTRLLLAMPAESSPCW